MKKRVLALAILTCLAFAGMTEAQTKTAAKPAAKTATKAAAPAKAAEPVAEPVAAPPPPPPAQATTTTRKKRVAVFDFDYATVRSGIAALFGSDIDVGKGISDLLV